MARGRAAAVAAAVAGARRRRRRDGRRRAASQQFGLGVDEDAHAHAWAPSEQADNFLQPEGAPPPTLPRRGAQRRGRRRWTARGANVAAVRLRRQRWRRGMRARPWVRGRDRAAGAHAPGRRQTAGVAAELPDGIIFDVLAIGRTQQAERRGEAKTVRTLILDEGTTRRVSRGCAPRLSDRPLPRLQGRLLPPTMSAPPDARARVARAQLSMAACWAYGNSAAGRAAACATSPTASTPELGTRPAESTRRWRRPPRRRRPRRRPRWPSAPRRAPARQPAALGARRERARPDRDHACPRRRPPPGRRRRAARARRRPPTPGGGGAAAGRRLGGGDAAAGSARGRRRQPRARGRTAATRARPAWTPHSLASPAA